MKTGLVDTIVVVYVIMIVDTGLVEVVVVV
jgi:hypothetical protein